MKGVFYRNGSLTKRWKRVFRKEIGFLQSCGEMRVSFVTENGGEMGVFHRVGERTKIGERCF